MSSAAAASAAGPALGSTDLAEFIDHDRSQVLNAAVKSSLGSVLNNLLAKTDGVVASDPDVDEQLLITVVFKTPVKLTGISFAAAEGESKVVANASGESGKCCPPSPGCLKNRPNDLRPPPPLTLLPASPPQAPRT